MIQKKRTTLLGILLIAVFSVHADITTTSQNLDEFSFKKGLKANGGISFSNDFYAGSDSLVNRDPYAFFLNGNLNVNLWGIAMPFSFSFRGHLKPGPSRKPSRTVTFQVFIGGRPINPATKTFTGSK